MSNYARYDWSIVLVSMIGKFAVSAGFELIYFWSAEMYPTSLRNSMLGVNSASARVAGMIAPVIADIVSYLKHCPVHYYQICAPFGKNIVIVRFVIYLAKRLFVIFE